MGRSNGYRPKKAVREEVMQLRAQLAQCDMSQWQKANMIMENITGLLGHYGGPMGGHISPRACKFCGYFGHTRQHCAKLKRMEEESAARVMREDAAMLAACEAFVPRPPYEVAKSAQALHFDRMGIPYAVHADLGAVVGLRGEVHHGKWTFSADGSVICA